MADIKEQLLLQEYERVCTDIRTLESGNEKIVGFGLSVVTAGFAVGMAQNVPSIFFIVPPALIGVFFYAVLQYTHVFSLGAYKAYLEKRLNEVIGERLLLWEPLVRKRSRGDVTRITLIAIYLLVSSVLIVMSILEVWRDYGDDTGMALLSVTIALFIALIFAIHRMNTMFDRMYAEAIALHDEVATGNE